MSDDPALRAARYRIAKLDPAAAQQEAAEQEAPKSAPTAAERAAYVETALQQAIRRGEFDNLPGAGKPLQGLTDRHDPDWWIRQKIERERLTGLGPPALTLRTEHAALDAKLDRLHREEDVREVVADFNKRVIEARRQLLGGPPVVTPTRDPDAEVAAWRQRRVAAARAARDAEDRRRASENAARPTNWRERRRAKREQPRG